MSVSPPPSIRYDSNASASDSSDEGDESEDEGAKKKKAKKAKVVKEKKERKPRKEVREQLGQGGNRFDRGFKQHFFQKDDCIIAHIYLSILFLCSIGVEEAERYRRPQEADECLHAVAQLQPRANQVGEPGNLHHRDIQEGRRDVETTGQRREGGEAGERTLDI